MLAQLPMRWAEAGNVEPLPDRIQGDGVRPPLAPGSFGLVAALGNLLGFAGAEGDALVASLVALLAPGGTLLLEVAPGPGERSRYLHRLPGSSVTRLLRSPPRFVASRIAIEGFTEEPRRRAVPGEFQRFDPATLRDRLEARGLLVEEIVAVAPALGPDATRAEAVARDPKAWGHLLEVEELVGRVPDRWPAAAAVLMAAVGPGAEEKGTRSPVRRSEG